MSWLILAKYAGCSISITSLYFPIYGLKVRAVPPNSTYIIPVSYSDIFFSSFEMKGLHNIVCEPTLFISTVKAELIIRIPCLAHDSKVGSKVIKLCGLRKSITESLTIFNDGDQSFSLVLASLPNNMPVATPF